MEQCEIKWTLQIHCFVLVDITMKDGTKRTFRINGKNIKESNDYCFDLGDKKYVETLWTMTK
jgi:hypothetical protein